MEPYLESCGLSNKELQQCLALKRDAGLLEVFKRLFQDSPERLPRFLHEFDLSWFFKDELPGFLDGGAAPEPGDETRYRTNLKLARGAEELGDSLRTWFGVRRRSLKKTWKKVPNEAAYRKAFGDLKALDDFLLWLFETQLATRCESRGYVFEPDDIVAFELNKNLALYIDVKDGILPVEGDFGREFLLETVYPHVLTMACIVGYVVEGGNFYVGHSAKDRKEFDQKQHRFVERLGGLVGQDLRKGIPEPARSAVAARLAEVVEPYRIVLEIDRCGKYLQYLEETTGDNWSQLRKPDPMRKCPACGGSDRWVGHKCEGCRHYFCPACVKKNRGNLCQKCADAGVVPVKEPAVREEAEALAEALRVEVGARASVFESALASASAASSKGGGLDSILSGGGGGTTTASLLGIVDTARETVSGFHQAVRVKFQTVKTVDATTLSVPCCGRETPLEGIDLADGKVLYGYCGKCLTAFVSG